jgi:branched-chain amino acid transport system substrate-binding protein
VRLNVLRRLLLALGLIALLPVRTSAADPFSLDIMLPVTGPAAFAGEAQTHVVQALERLVNRTGGIHGRPVHFEIHDDQSSPTVAVQIVNELLPKKPVVILGPSIAATCSAISPLLAGGVGPVNYCFSPVSVPPRGGYVFAATAPADALIGSEVAHLKQMGFKRAALLVATDASGQQNAALFVKFLSAPDSTVKLVADERFSPTAVGIAAQLAKVKAANPDVLLAWAGGTAFVTTMREISNSGIDVPVITNPFNADNDLLKRNAAIVPKALIVQGLPYQGKRPSRALRNAGLEYVNALKDVGVAAPSVIMGYAWDPMKIVIAALRALPENATPAQLHDYLENLHDFPGIFGLYDMRSGDQYGQTGAALPLVKWDPARGEWTPLT